MNRTDLVREIISELKEKDGNENIKKITAELEDDSALLELFDHSNSLPTAICGANEAKEITEQVLRACNRIKDLQNAITTGITVIGKQRIPNTQQGRNIIRGYRTNLRQLNKYLTLVYLLKEELINIKTFDVLVDNYRPKIGGQKFGGLNKRKKETRKNKSKRKKPKNKSKREKPKNKSKRKKPKNKSTRKTKQ
tara:strand:+ start:1208 stop:1789 length:582 start_codon:yes stop_codon:yes gene_type:complete